MRQRTSMTVLAAAASLALVLPALAQDGSAQGTDDSATAESGADTANPGAVPRAGMGQGGGMMRGQQGGMGMMRGQQGGMGMMHGQQGGMGMMRGRHHGGGKGYRGHMRGGSAPTLRIVTDTEGFSIEFVCNAEMADCLEAIDRVYESAGHARRGDD